MEFEKIPLTNGSVHATILPSKADENTQINTSLNNLITTPLNESRNEEAKKHEQFHESQNNTTEIKVNLSSNSPHENEIPPTYFTPSPPDGGLRACLVVIGSFLCNGIIFGTINSNGVIFVEIKKNLEKEGVENPASMASIASSLAIGTTFLLSMLAGVLTDRLGIRTTTVLGGAFATLGMFLSSLYYMQEKIYIITMGLVFGTGASLAYTPSLVILGHYFQKRLGIVNGFVTCGSSVFTIIITEVLKLTIETKGLKTAFQVLTGLMSIVMFSGFIFKPFLPDNPHPKYSERTPEKLKNWGQNRRKLRRKLLEILNVFGINMNIWRNKKYIVWTLAIPLALFGYFVPYVHLVAYAKSVLGEDTDSQILVQCIGLTSGVGRLIFGLVADRASVNRIMLQQLSFFCIGILTMLLTAANQFWQFIVIALGMGLFDGCFISLLGPIAFDIVGHANASQAIGCLLAFCSIPLTIGPYVAGVLYDRMGSYLVSFLCAGIPPILGGFALFFIKCVDDSANKNTQLYVQNNAIEMETLDSCEKTTDNCEKMPLNAGNSEKIPLNLKNGEKDPLNVEMGEKTPLNPGKCEKMSPKYENFAKTASTSDFVDLNVGK